MKGKKNWKIVYKIIQDYLKEEHGTPMMKKPYKDDGNLVFTDCDGYKFGVDELISWYKTLVDDGNIDDDLGLLTTLDLIPSHSDSTDGLPQIKIIGEPVKIGNIEIAQHYFPEYKNWDDSKKACADLGNGWRLPTKDELNLMYINRVAIGGFTNNIYWSSTEYDNDNAWLQYFANGNQFNHYKFFTGYVRAVRDVPYL